jgi:NAD dependent epimerase/dehydratase
MMKTMQDPTGIRVLVTGADGFIGSHLTELLLEEGYRVRALSLYNSFNFRGWLEGLEHPNLEIVSGDIRDPHFCREIARGTGIIFNLAALIAIPFSYVAPDLYLETNIRGTLNICQAARDLGSVRVVHTSTSEVYGTARYAPIDENHPKQPQSPYSASKIGADAMALSFHMAYGVPVTVARPFNTYGPRQSARAVIPTIITQIASGMKEIALGDITPTRDFTFVTDTCRGLLALAMANEAIGREVNIATGQEISIGDLFETIRDIMGSDARIITDDQRLRPADSEVYRLLGDNRLLKELTGFTPDIPLRVGLKTTCNWFKTPQNLAKYKPGEYNV